MLRIENISVSGGLERGYTTVYQELFNFARRLSFASTGCSYVIFTPNVVVRSPGVCATVGVLLSQRRMPSISGEGNR